MHPIGNQLMPASSAQHLPPWHIAGRDQHRHYFVAVLLLLLLSMPLTAQTEDAGQDIEEIEITGQRNSLSIRIEIQRLEAHMFDLFNELNSDDDFDVACGYHTPTGSKISHWQCEVAYMRDAEAREYQDFLQFGTLPRTYEQLAFANRDKQQQLNDEMKALALEHPELASAMIALHERRQQLEKMEKQRSSESFLGRLFGGAKESE